MIDGLYETHLVVDDVETQMEFYEDTLGFELGKYDEDRGIAFYFIPGENESMLGLWENEPSDCPHFAAGHFAVRVSEDDIPSMIPFVEERGIEPKEMYGCSAEEPIVQPWLPAANVYFDDPEGNLVELHAKLPDEPDLDAEQMSLSEWRDRN